MFLFMLFPIFRLDIPIRRGGTVPLSWMLRGVRVCLATRIASGFGGVLCQRLWSEIVCISPGRPGFLGVSSQGLLFPGPRPWPTPVCLLPVASCLAALPHPYPPLSPSGGLSWASPGHLLQLPVLGPDLPPRGPAPRLRHRWFFFLRG